MSDQEHLSHLDPAGEARMVDVGAKSETERRARARGLVLVSEETLAAVRRGDSKKGDIRAVAQLAGIMAAKRTAELIPLCHPLPITHIEVSVRFKDSPAGIEVEATAATKARTGVEMEALTAVSVAALTVYDMVKGLEREARITDIRLIEKHGGRSGDVVLESS